MPSPAIPASRTTESSWVESLEAGGRLHLLSLHLVSLHLVSHRFVSPSSLHLVSLYVVGLRLFSHHHLFILSPITFILFPRIPSCCLRVPTHLFLIIILHSHYLFILSTVAPSSCLGSCFLALVSHWFVVPYLLSLSLSFPMLFILSPIILSLPVRFLTMCWVWWEVIFWLCCCWVAQLG